jgi:uncharacterized protein (UPF0305 family)
MDKLESKLDKLTDSIADIRETQVRMEADLKYHIKRTDLLEGHVEKLEEQVEKNAQSMSTKEKLQIGAFIAAIVSAITATLKQLGL